MSSRYSILARWCKTGEMIRWRYCLVLAMMLLLPAKTSSVLDDDGKDDGDDENEEKPVVAAGKREIVIVPTRMTKKLPLKCYICVDQAITPLKACLNPIKHRVHTITCHSSKAKCFTSVVSKDSSNKTVVRGCLSGCVESHDTTCCESNRCNNQVFAIPVIARRSLTSTNKFNKSTKSIPPTIFFFVTVLLVLQTVVKVAFV